MITIFIPTPLRRFTSDKSSVIVAARNVTEAIRQLITSHPSLSPYIYDESELIRKHVRIYLGEEDIREKQGTDTLLKDGDELSIIPAIAGGSGLVN
ncbi:MAG: MoaD/ThiS family protein [Saprospiraceae bacterium]|uniref:MoaD/ThiS family protein n=1 Tax=Candidatus Opimibacter skivensis TaxID=2982028 RepID=A0A9D7SSB6_9BACT|nr:MoaD/ThiS family protein [Candidatus Opimibacter skivensis]